MNYSTKGYLSVTHALDAIRTTVSSLIVSIVIHVAAYVQMLIATARRIVSVTMMTGVTFLLSGNKLT